MPEVGDTAAAGTEPGSVGPSMRHGTRIGIDVGTVRIGVARSDPSGFLATPVRTVARSGKRAGVTEIAGIVAEHEAIEVIVGLPKALSGAEGAAAAAVRAYAMDVAAGIHPIPVRLIDERLTTVSAHQALHASGRGGKSHRSVVDQVAAVLILQAALDAERSLGRPPGTPLERSNPARKEDGTS